MKSRRWLIRFAGLIFLICLSFQNFFSQTKAPNHIIWNTLGSEERIEYIDVGRLRSDTVQLDKEFNAIDLTDAPNRIEKKSFYKNGEMNNDSCNGGSILRKGIIHYCLPNVGIGSHMKHQDPNINGQFYSLNGYGLDVFYDVAKKEFYFFSWHWMYYKGFGPFKGNPKVELPKVLKPRREKPLELNIETTILGQRWLYPNADKVDLCTGKTYGVQNALNPCEIQQMQLNAAATKIRLKNNGESDLFFYRGNQYAESFSYVEVLGNEKVKRSEIPYRLLPASRTYEWQKIPKGGTYEFEVEALGDKSGAHSPLLIFNDQPIAWDEVGLYVWLPPMFREVKKAANVTKE